MLSIKIEPSNLVPQNHDEQLALSMEEKLISMPAWSCDSCIFRVHEKHRKRYESDYEPTVVSIGPFHRGKEKLQVVENHKWYYLRSLIERKQNLTLQICIKAVRELEERSRKCYTETIVPDSDTFVEMMVLDGCFILENLFRAEVRSLREDDDFIFTTLWMDDNVARDFILIENQIPFFILECLFDLTVVPEIENFSLVDLVLLYFKLPRNQDPQGNNYQDASTSRRNTNNLEGRHLLDLIRENYIQFTEISRDTKRKSLELVHCLTDLQDAGVKLKVNTKNNLVDIRFKDGVLEIPHLLLDSFTAPLLRNLVTYEQFCDTYGLFITDYIYFLDSLVNSANDVRLLHRYEIIENCTGNYEQAAKVINSLTDRISFNVEIFNYFDICKEVNAYHRTRWHVWKASLKRNYANSPWAVLSLIGAIVLLILTFLQTVFTIRG